MNIVRRQSSSTQRRAVTVLVTAIAVLGFCASVASCGTSSAPSQAQAQTVDPKQSKKQDKSDGPLRVAFLGDSYVAGEGAKDPKETRWTARVSAKNGWIEVNLGLGGTGYTTPGPKEMDTTYVQRVRTVEEANPDLVVVSGGRNDLEAPTDKIRTEAAELFKELEGLEGSPPVVVVAPLWDASPTPDVFDAATRAIEDAARKARVPFIAINEQPLSGRPELISSDGLHPNADGYRVIAELLAPRLKDAIRAN